jgi:hypothetical protein
VVDRVREIEQNEAWIINRFSVCEQVGRSRLRDDNLVIFDVDLRSPAAMRSSYHKNKERRPKPTPYPALPSSSGSLASMAKEKPCEEQGFAGLL